MITGGNATVYVSNMDAAIRFYSDILGLRLTNRFGDRWATVHAAPGLTIGLHPASAEYPAPGTRGSVMFGFEIDEPIENAVARLKSKGVRFTGEIVHGNGGSFASLADPDGNPIYLWEVIEGLKTSNSATHETTA
jgi:catechol 2,3-dioxygenase-like lactoylglutathione lyase family enzyme